VFSEQRCCLRFKIWYWLPWIPWYYDTSPPKPNPTLSFLLLKSNWLVLNITIFWTGSHQLQVFLQRSPWVSFQLEVPSPVQRPNPINFFMLGLYGAIMSMARQVLPAELAQWKSDSSQESGWSILFSRWYNWSLEGDQRGLVGRTVQREVWFVPFQSCWENRIPRVSSFIHEGSSHFDRRKVFFLYSDSELPTQYLTSSPGYTYTPTPVPHPY